MNIEDSFNALIRSIKDLKKSVVELQTCKVKELQQNTCCLCFVDYTDYREISFQGDIKGREVTLKIPMAYTKKEAICPHCMRKLIRKGNISFDYYEFIGSDL